MILDTGFLISVDRGEEAVRTFLTAALRARAPLHTSEAVVAQAWRDGATQARAARFLPSVVIHPLDDGRAVGRLLAQSATSDVVDAHVVLLGLRLGDSILTSDVADLTAIVDGLGGAAPSVHRWPPT